MKIYNKKTSAIRKTTFLILLLAIIIACIAVYILIAKPGIDNNESQAPKQSDSTEEITVEGIDYSPPSDQDSAEGKSAKNQSSLNEPEKDGETIGNPVSKQTVSVGISYADVYGDNLEIRAFTNSTITGNSTCTATIINSDNSSVKLVRSTDAFIDTSSTLCKPIYVPTSELGPGTWEVTVSFSSPKHQGVSSPEKVRIK